MWSSIQAIDALLLKQHGVLKKTKDAVGYYSDPGSEREYVSDNKSPTKKDEAENDSEVLVAML